MSAPSRADLLVAALHAILPAGVEVIVERRRPEGAGERHLVDCAVAVRAYDAEEAGGDPVREVGVFLKGYRAGRRAALGRLGLLGVPQGVPAPGEGVAGRGGALAVVLGDERGE